MRRLLPFCLALCLPTLALPAAGDGERGGARPAALDVMSQNQYLGADLGPVIAAPDAASFNAALVEALEQIAANRLPERAERLALGIALRDPDLVGQQEMFRFECFDLSPAAPGCADPAIAGAFNDHLAETLAALAAFHAPYDVAGIVVNLDLGTPIAPGLPPGLPVDLDFDGTPDITVTVLDRDVILARRGVATRVVHFPCSRPSGDGCNFDNVASVNTPAGPISIERGFVGVDAEVRGRSYRFVNTHLEVMNLVDVPAPPGVVPGGSVQAAQASELSALVAASLFTDPAPPGTRTVLVGDINSSPDDGPFVDPLFPIPGQVLVPPYAQLAGGVDLFGAPAAGPWTDGWTAQRRPRDGFTCCQDSDLRNQRSRLDERIDVIFTLEPPRDARFGLVLGSTFLSKTASGLWPSDHGQPALRLLFD